MPPANSAIDPLTQPDHGYLDEDDNCFFLGEYTARKGFAYSDTNNLILNLKKKPDRRGRSEWRYKAQAIRTAGTALRNAVNNDWLESATFVPIPPSKAKNDPLYDDRMTRVLQGINPRHPVDYRELIVQTVSTDAVHESEDRPGPADILALYTLDVDLQDPPPNQIAICDDLLTTGAHFKAAQEILRAAFPEAEIVGCFIARRVPEAIDIEAFFEGLDDLQD